MTAARALAAAGLCAGLLACAPEKPPAVAKLQTIAREERPEKLVLRGRTFAAVGDWTRAEQYFVQALEAGAAPRQVVPLLLEACVADGRYRLAVKYAEEHLAKDPTDHGALFVLGTLYAAVGEPDAAERTLRRVIAVIPEQAEPHFALGVLLRDVQRDAVGASTEFTSYLERAPRGPHADEARAALRAGATPLPVPLGTP